MAADSTLRNRRPARDTDDEPRVVEIFSDDENDEDVPLAVAAGTATIKDVSATAEDDDDDKYTPWVDILRVVTFLIVASCALSLLVSNGESWAWGMRDKPRYLRLSWWKAQITPPLLLTPDELAEFDGSDAGKPIYLAINGTIFDVSAGARMYGPGGGYHGFAGMDASRSFVTGCFSEDRTPDMRGVEEMYLPNDDGINMAHYYSDEELEELRRTELAAAVKRVDDGLAHWVKFFTKSDKYHEVGRVVREDGWLEKLPRRELCRQAYKARPKRKIPADRKGRV